MKEFPSGMNKKYCETGSILCIFQGFLTNFRIIPDKAFGFKPIVRIRDIDAVVHNYLLFKERADKTGSICAAVLKAEVYGLQMKYVAPELYNVGARYFFAFK